LRRLLDPKHQQAPRLPGAPAEFTALHIRRYTSFTFLSGRLRTGLPVAAKIALYLHFCLVGRDPHGGVHRLHAMVSQNWPLLHRRPLYERFGESLAAAQR
jgi:hypothetical protein